MRFRPHGPAINSKMSGLRNPQKPIRRSLFIRLLVNPSVIDTLQPSRVAFLMINLIMLGAAGTAGWYGGKLVFRD